MLVTLLMLAAPALQDTGQPSTVPPQLTACRSISGDAARLRCFDTAMAKLDGNTTNDPESARRAERARFGMAGSPERVERTRTPEPVKIERIDAKVRSVSSAFDGRPTVTLDDGAVWQFTSEIAVPPRPGDRIVIRRAALGSYMAAINDRREARVQRRR